MARESRFAEIYRQQLMKDKGIFGAFASTASERGKEMTDLRRLLPKSGITGAISQRVFGKPYRSGSVSDKADSARISRVDMNSQVTARNTSVLPAMAREMNLTRLNMQKLVKMAGGTPSKTSTLKDTSLKKESSSVIGKTVGGIGSAAGGILGGLFSALGGLGSGLISIGGSILSGVVGLLGSAGKAIFGVVGSALMAMGPIGIILSAGVAYLLYEFTKNVDFGEIGTSIKNFFTSGDFLNSLYGGAEKVDKFLGVNFFTPMLDSLVSTFVNMHNRIVDFTALAKAEIEIMGGNVVTIVKDMAINVAAILAGAAGLRAASDIILSPDTYGGDDTRKDDKKGGRRRGGLRGAAVRTLPKTGYPGAAGALVSAGTAGSVAATAGEVISRRIGIVAAKKVAAGVLRMAGYFFGGPVGWLLGVGLTIYQISEILDEAGIKKSDIDELVKDKLLSREDGETLKDLRDMDEIKSELQKPNLPARDIEDLTARLREHEQKGTEKKAQDILNRYKDTNQNNTLDSDDIIRRRALEEAKKQHMTMPTRVKVTQADGQDWRSLERADQGSYGSTKLNAQQSQMADLIRKKFTDAGFSPEQAEAAVVNAYAESRLNPKAESPDTPKEKSYGLFQMNTKGGLGTNHDPEKLKDPNYNIDLMIKAAKGKAGERFRNATDLNTAISTFTEDLEKPANAALQGQRRIQLAKNMGFKTDAINNNNQNQPNIFDNMLAMISGVVGLITETNKNIQGVAQTVAATTAGSEQNSNVIASPYDMELREMLLQFHSDIATPLGS